MVPRRPATMILMRQKQSMPRPCSRGTKKSAKLVRNCDGKYVCVRYGDPHMSIKKHLKSNKRSFCARHNCHKKTDPATPGFQSCKAWDCKTGKVCGGSRRTAKTEKRLYKARTPKRSRTRSSRPQRRQTRSRRRSTSYKTKTQRRPSKCWKGYKRSGWKMKNGRRVPHCVKS